MSSLEPLIGGFTTPYDGFREIFFYAITFEITNTKVTLRLCKSLNSGFTTPFNGFR